MGDFPADAVSYEGQNHDPDLFRSLKIETPDGVLNLLLTKHEGFYDDFVLATDTAKALRLSLRADRVILFQSILYRLGPQPESEVSLSNQ